MLAGLRKNLSSALGIVDEEGVAKRATFIVDPHGIIRFASVTDMSDPPRGRFFAPPKRFRCATHATPGRRRLERVRRRTRGTLE